MLVYNFDATGLYLGHHTARPNPAYGWDLDVDQPECLIPRNATTVPPPSVTGDAFARWSGAAWEVARPEEEA